METSHDSARTSSRRASMASRGTNGTNNKHAGHKYKVFVKGKEFVLSYEQIMQDEPNVFTLAFLQDFTEAKSRSLSFDRSPELFSIIVDHLSGYRILPLSPAALPRTMTMPVALDNLAADAIFYGLDRLLDLLTLPPILKGLSRKYKVTDCVRLSDVANGRLSDTFGWTDDGLVQLGENSTTPEGGPKHPMVFCQDVTFRIDLTCRANGDCHQALFGIELPSYLSGLRTKPLNFREESQDWVATPAESLATTPLALDGFSGTFSDLPRWAGSFLTSNGHLPPDPQPFPDTLRVLDTILPGLAEEFRKSGARGQTAVKFTTHLWADEISLVIAPAKVGGGKELVAMVLNVRLSTGLERRRRARPICVLASENGWDLY